MKSLSHVWLFATPWIVAHEAPPFMEFSKQEYWSGLPFPSPEDLLDPGIEPRSPTLQADVLLSEPPGKLVNKTYLENNWERKWAIAFSTGEEGKEVGQEQEYFTSQT